MVFHAVCILTGISMARRIEEVIQSDKFRSEYHKATLNLMITAHRIASHHSEIFKKYQLTGQQYNVLRILRGRHPEPCTLLSVRERMVDKMSDVSRIIERLRVAGFVERSSCSEDRRAVDIRISDKGLQLLESMQVEEEVMDSVMKNLTPQEAKELNELLNKLRD
jgi:MarR family multiple gene transcriptional regulator MgrA